MMIAELDHPLADNRPTVAVWGGIPVPYSGQATVTTKITSRAGQLFLGGWREFPVADRNGMDMDGRVRIQLTIFAQPGCEARDPQGMDQGFHIILQHDIGTLAHDGEIHRTAAQVRSKGS